MSFTFFPYSTLFRSLFSSLVILYSIMRLFIQVFFGAPANLEDLKPIKYDKLLFSAIGLVVVSIIFGLSADLLYPYFEMAAQDRKSTRLNSSHVSISYAVFC